MINDRNGNRNCGNWFAALLVTVVAASVSASEFQLNSGYQFFPLEIQVNNESIAVRSFRLTGSLDANLAGSGSLVLDGRTGSPNEFGDVTERSAGLVKELPFQISRSVEQSNRGFGTGGIGMGRDRFEITFPGHSVNQKFALIFGEPSYLPHQLLIGSSTTPSAFEPEGGTQFRIQMEGEPALARLIASEPTEGSIRLSGIYTTAKNQLRQLTIETRADGTAQLILNPNNLGLTWLGDIGFMTSMGYRPNPVVIKKIDIADPLNRGRKLFRIRSESQQNTNEAVLVMGPANDSPDHRLLIYRGETIWTLVPLIEDAWGDTLIRAYQAQSLPATEQAVLKFLEIELKGRFSMHPSKGHVSSLTIRGKGNLPSMQTVWEGLTSLESLDINRCNLRGSALDGVSSLSQLTYLGVRECTLDRASIEAISTLSLLETLAVSNCRGYTNPDLVSLSGMTGLKNLRLDNESVAREPDWAVNAFSHEGLLALQLPASLSSLNLMGQNLSDESLKELSRLPSLTQLYVSGAGITDQGIEMLSDFPALKFIQLTQTSVSDEALQSLKKKLPDLRVEHHNWEHRKGNDTLE